MINTRDLTVDRFRSMFLDEDSADADRLRNEIASLRTRTGKNKLGAFEGFLLVLLGTSNPGDRYNQILVDDENINISNLGSARGTFQQNSNKFWNIKIDGVFRNCLFGDELSVKDARGNSEKMTEFISKAADNKQLTVEECYLDLIRRLENSMYYSTAKKDIDKKINDLKNAYILISSGSEDEIASEDSRGQYSQVIEKYIQRLVENGIKQIVLTGAPGTGKTYAAQKFAEYYADAGEIDGKKFAFVQFHSSYDYTDFMEGLRPAQIEGSEDMQFVKLDGTFKKFCRKVAEENEENEEKDIKYFFIIDEINRADLSKVFGELMFALEDSYRGKPFDTQYKNIPTYEIADGIAKRLEKDIFKNGFFVPENVYIIGTMNDIDRSVEAFDFALRRRFMWIDVKANDVMDDVLKNMQKNGAINENIDIARLSASVKALNDEISGEEGRSSFGLTEAYHIGPAYLKTKAGDIDTAKKEIWEYRIEPILKEYCRGYSDTFEFINNCRNAFFR